MEAITQEELRTIIKDMDTPRQPTPDELRELIEYSMRNYKETDFRSLPLPQYVAVFDNYMTDSPGYIGKLLVVVWGGGPGFVQSFIWEKGKPMEEVENEFTATEE